MSLGQTFCAVGLIPIPSVSLDGICRHTTSRICSTQVWSAAIFNKHFLAQFGWIALSIGDSSFNFIWSLNAGHSRHRRHIHSCSSWWGWCYNSSYRWYHSLRQCIVLCYQSPLLRIRHVLLDPSAFSFFYCPDPQMDSYPVVHNMVCTILPAGFHLHLTYVALVGSPFLVHLLLNAMWLPVR